ncbi:50S ribosomal protein L17 [Lyticum sinuosum]|uniref:Large ribosomal subunit protein bL17 n=1 Tax=Lyticum sinuosum TaxID=1332059 RepID=A0AAE5AHY8_9RICK|nr:50S ribosomal protein L17 [Lyticum sinuosum]MDZ5761566.1 50S ribosomal protein L17 [Lyticum sinuosum]
MTNRHKNTKFGRKSGHRKALIRNLAKAIIQHRRIETTLIKAKDIRGTVERLVTIAKRGTLHSYRTIISRLGNDSKIAKILYDEIAPIYKKRPGGYLRIMRHGFRTGDSAPMAIIEFIGYDPDTRSIKA